MSVVERETVERVAPVRAVPSVGDVLTRAADLIEEWGWCQGRMRDGDAFCMVGATYQAMLDLGFPPADEGDGESTYAATDPFLRPIFGAMVNAEGWNDDNGRTKAEVVAALRAAAKDAS